VQTLDRTQPALPSKNGRARAFTHDYVRHGTATLLAALNVADGTVIDQCQAPHRHIEWLRFLRLLDEQKAVHRDLHLILDNYSTHKHPKVKAWLKKHPASTGVKVDQFDLSAVLSTNRSEWICFQSTN